VNESVAQVAVAPLSINEVITGGVVSATIHVVNTDDNTVCWRLPDESVAVKYTM
jgi:hypothetical protein